MDYKENYMMLGRLQLDCEYCILTGNIRHLYYSNDIDGQIAEMKRLHNGFTGKPEWLNIDDINVFATKLKQIKSRNN